ncbi:MAG: hypothetical protein KDK41_15280 [Leptospiraceae bacterium]|nr:hypothetical protein [Leptospiraceae bacterium]
MKSIRISTTQYIKWQINETYGSLLAFESAKKLPARALSKLFGGLHNSRTLKVLSNEFNIPEQVIWQSIKTRRARVVAIVSAATPAMANVLDGT